MFSWLLLQSHLGHQKQPCWQHLPVFAGGTGAPSTQPCLGLLQGKRCHHLKCPEISYTLFPPQNVEVITECNCVMLDCAYVSRELDL